MSIASFVPRDAAARKPPHGSPCNNCGVCCIGTLCPLAQHVFRRPLPGPCPALSFDGNESKCGLVAEPAKHAPFVAMRWGREAASDAAAHFIGAGTGCDCRVNGEPKNEAFYKLLEEHDRKTAAKTRRALRIWGL